MAALQRSRRVFPANRLEESTENETDGSHASLDHDDESGDFGQRKRGIRSSWNGNRSYYTRTRDGQPALKMVDDSGEEDARGKMVDVGLESTIADDDPPADLTMETPVDASPPAFQKFRSLAAEPTRFSAPPGRRYSSTESELGMPPPSSVDTNANAAPAVTEPDSEIFRHDPFFAWIYLIAMASLFATFVLVFLHTTPPSSKKPWGDTIYTTLRASFDLLAVDTLVAIIVSLIWLAALRSFVRPLVMVILVAVPVVLVSFSLYPLISSYKGRTGGTGFQDVAMRWASVVPAVSAIVWVYLVYKGQHALRSAVNILEFASTILAANSALVLVGMACLAGVVIWTWIWLAMFTRVFLGGSSAGALASFIISASTWWLGVYFVLMYLWTISIFSGVQRGTTAATVSQWYFHRNAVPAPSSREVVSAALNHSLTTIFGSICLSTMLALVIRLPLLVLPRRMANMLSMFVYSFVPTPIAALTNPLTLTYAAIHSQPLAIAARGLSQMDFLSPKAPTTTLTPAAVSSAQGRYSPLLPYRLAKLILHATRFIMAIALGFAGWVMTARQLTITPPGGVGSIIQGSAYAYVVGLVASFIGWGVLGAMEGILSGIVDAAVICYGSEKRMVVGGGGYCIQAAQLFGGQGTSRGDLRR
ncbi:hypothetical protein GQ53DRAFT_247470 [Thozetella sp. PMI_491]|nr:hypothetical protein GQ53DRAFT_247470 [Thozetella sp. PMI_491]